MDKQTALEALTRLVENGQENQSSQTVNHYGSGDVIINNGNIYNNIDNNKKLTESNKREIHALIDKLEQQNQQLGIQSANDA